MNTQSTAQSLVREGFAAVQQNRPAQARQAYEQALEIDQNCVEAHVGLAQIRFPGEPYLDVLARIHHALQPKTYVEIGVATGASMACAHPTTRCIGIDPEPTLRVKFSPTAEIHLLTSHDFFEAYNLRELLDGQSVDLGFIDGLHLFENVLEDFANLERYCSQDGTLLIHDCVPINAQVASRERRSEFWTGDVWRLLPTLARFRPDLSLTVIESPPSGLTVVQGLDPRSDVLTKNREVALAYGFALNFGVTENLAALGIKLFPSTWTTASRLFAKSPI